MRINILTIVFISAMGIQLSGTSLGFAEEIQPANGDRSKTKEEQSRQILIEVERLKMDLAEKLMKKKQVDLENLTAMMMEDDNIVTVSEVNKADEAYERAVDVYEQSKLTLQQVELDSLQDEWHIIVEKTRLYESVDGREMFSIILRNSSSPVKLVESSKVLGRDIIISAQIDDIFVSIKEQESYGASGAIITEPYEQQIETLKEGESITLEFELIKENVRDVVVELTYSGREDQKNIHLKQEDPHISVVSARRYKQGDRRAFRSRHHLRCARRRDRGNRHQHRTRDQQCLCLYQRRHGIYHRFSIRIPDSEVKRWSEENPRL